MTYTKSFILRFPGASGSEVREGASAHDDMGATATEAVGHTVAQFENEELTALWKSITEREGLHEQERN